jgi:hypothetical protein
MNMFFSSLVLCFGPKVEIKHFSCNCRECGETGTLLGKKTHDSQYIEITEEKMD